ncbi:YciI family protein [Rhodophyticola porphyridii]|uniref:YciI family protein n=1 Tax=Rhodophyticola porphyridii TaxID=1852017 RepID=UPI001B0F4DD7|nr:hypothetical protein [Roseicyclus sp.]MBO6625377.1 hypothetical protein [Roseicyclus sp.]MBO6922556.1 hypothetical protein [Roseicyclus sp.]
MPKYIYVYHGGAKPETEAEQQRVMAAWGAWMDGLGSKLADGGAPVGQSKTVTKDGVSDGGGANPISGYSMVEAADHDEAAKMAAGCPILDDGGTVEVAEILPM